MAISPLAGKPAPRELLLDLARLKLDYFERRPDKADPDQRVVFGTSGHRGKVVARVIRTDEEWMIAKMVCGIFGTAAGVT